MIANEFLQTSDFPQQGHPHKRLLRKYEPLPPDPSQTLKRPEDLLSVCLLAGTSFSSSHRAARVQSIFQRVHYKSRHYSQLRGERSPRAPHHLTRNIFESTQCLRTSHIQCHLNDKAIHELGPSRIPQRGGRCCLARGASSLAVF